MIPFVMTVALTITAGYEPAGDVPLHKVPGPVFLIPCKVEAADLVTGVQLWVSTDRGKKWELYEEIGPDRPAFTFAAKKAGEYWFCPRIKKKDGTFLPPDTNSLFPSQRVAVAHGDDRSEPTAKPIAPTAADAVNELDEELTRVELDLIRKEIKRLSEMKELTPEAEQKFDRLRDRLRDVRDHLRRGDRPPIASAVPAPAPYPDPLPNPPSLPRPTVVPSAPVPAVDEGRIPPSTVPTDPLVIPSAPMPVPARPVAPPPRVPER